MVDVVCINYWVFLGLIGNWIACFFVFYGRERCMHLYHLGGRSWNVPVRPQYLQLN
jgi:hypothetical protein